MGLSLIVDPSNRAVPLDLTIHKDGVGAVSGQSPTVALRDAATNNYLDFADNTFKASNWTTKYVMMPEVEPGRYQYVVSLPVLTPAPTSGKALIAEYSVDSSAGKGSDHDVLLIASAANTDVSILRKGLTNRLEETPGNPGILVLFDDDGITPLLTWYIRDAQGGPIVGGVGAPARRSAGAFVR